MSRERYEELCQALEESCEKGRRTSKTGIGLGNIYRRVHTMYKGGQVRIVSTPGRGTVVQMWIPQEREEGERQDVSDTDRR